MLALNMWQTKSPGSLKQLFCPRTDILASLGGELLKKSPPPQENPFSLKTGVILSQVGEEDSVEIDITPGSIWLLTSDLLIWGTSF